MWPACFANQPLWHLGLREFVHWNLTPFDLHCPLEHHSLTLNIQEKLGSDSDMTLNTIRQLEEIIDRERNIASEALENAQLYSKADQFQARGSSVG